MSAVDPTTSVTVHLPAGKATSRNLRYWSVRGQMVTTTSSTIGLPVTVAPAGPDDDTGVCASTGYSAQAALDVGLALVAAALAAGAELPDAGR